MSQTNDPIHDQPPPTPNAGRPIWDLVIEDMKDRDSVGRERYRTPLQAHNGRDALVDAYQESLDQCVYLRQAIEERKAAPPRVDPFHKKYGDSVVFYHWKTSWFALLTLKVRLGKWPWRLFFGDDVQHVQFSMDLAEEAYQIRKAEAGKE